MALRLGTENKRNVAIAATLGVIVVGLVIWEVYHFFLSPSPVPAPPPAATASVGAAAGSGSGQNAERVPVNLSKLDPTLHPEVMAEAESLLYTGSGRNIFSMNSAPPVKIEQVKGPVRPVQQQVAQGPSGPPPPPPIDLQFFGYEARGNVRKAFLLHGNNIFIASEGEVVDHRYKVVKILPFSVQVTDLLYNHTESLPLTRS
ncbi:MULTISPECIES: hypothetical protein [Acidobacterium]|uniref:Uncharacterized protein n=1 Tax=Acidobacterium capsulatum (strain ATCC 51196 / DSM 11244 / BCRC 80197 / JCM 7670 / NBRC 15755 / NCIMB 13165 / 161) TaxID=240015 RepID=C1F519_ACIC5|nr:MULTISPECIES: hypothetical protein [Acidobacterium]ACO34419.1 hypothetical protein ACP_3106 [Acidobacterium capsulatum ATCC 51196]HCT61876.1 hypothetical protein [Acidobacterium sp.]